MITIWANESQVDVAVVDIDVAVVDVDVAVLMTHYTYIYGTYADQNAFQCLFTDVMCILKFLKLLCNQPYTVHAACHIF